MSIYRYNLCMYIYILGLIHPEVSKSLSGCGPCQRLTVNTLVFDFKTETKTRCLWSKNSPTRPVNNVFNHNQNWKQKHPTIKHINV